MQLAMYILYDNNEMPVCVGTAQECTKFLGKTDKYFRDVVSRTKRGVYKGNTYLAYRIEEDIKDEI